MDKESISRLVSAGMTHTCEETTPDSQIEQYITNPGARTVYTDVTAPRPDATKISDSTGTQEPG